jgi:hypothetical protein
MIDRLLYQPRQTAQVLEKASKRGYRRHYLYQREESHLQQKGRIPFRLYLLWSSLISASRSHVTSINILQRSVLASSAGPRYEYQDHLFLFGRVNCCHHIYLVIVMCTKLHNVISFHRSISVTAVVSRIGVSDGVILSHPFLRAKCRYFLIAHLHVTAKYQYPFGDCDIRVPCRYAELVPGPIAETPEEVLLVPAWYRA